MAILYVTEYKGMPFGTEAPIAKEPAEADQIVTFTTAVSSNAFSASTYIVRMVSDTDCRVKFGATPTAVATSQFLSAGVEYWRGVTPGHKVSAYDGSS